MPKIIRRSLSATAEKEDEKDEGYLENRTGELGEHAHVGVLSELAPLPVGQRRSGFILRKSEHFFVVEVARLPVASSDAGEFWRIPLQKSAARAYGKIPISP